LEKAAAVVTPTRAAAADLQDSFGYDRWAQVIPNGLSAAAAEGGGERAGAASVGRIWDEAKQFELVAKAAQMAQLEVAVAGERRHPARGGEVALPQGLQWRGCLDRAGVAKLLRSCAVYVAASRYEPFGLAALEAAQAGCRLLLADLPSLREVWAEAATYFDRDAPAALAQELQSLLSSPDLGTAAGRARRYEPQAMAAAYEAVYASVV